MIKKKNYEFDIAGLTSEGKLLILVDDHLYGKCAYVITDIAEDDVKVEFEIIKTFVENVPEARQNKILNDILQQLVVETRDL